MRLNQGGNLARINLVEVITGLWEFSHTNGIKIDIISERTADAGVTIDGVQLKDEVVTMLGRTFSVDVILRSGLGIEGFNRFELTAGGELHWGGGVSDVDIHLRRSAANELTLDDALRILGNEGLDVHVIRERSGGFGVRIENVLLIDGVVVIEDIVSGTKNIFATKVTGDSFFRILIDADGMHTWGTGIAVGDTNLYRDDVGVLATDGILRVGTAPGDGVMTDEIVERTADVGVTIDGVLLKDGGVLESAIVDEDVIARIAADEVITGLYEFAHVSGFKTDVITERSAGVGVTIDGALVKDGGLSVDGIAFDSRAITLGVGDNNDLATLDDSCLVLLGNVSGSNLTGMVAPTTSLTVYLMNPTGFGIVIKHEDVGSSAANRFGLVSSADYTLQVREVLMAIYDLAEARWFLAR